MFPPWEGGLFQGLFELHQCIFIVNIVVGMKFLSLFFPFMYEKDYYRTW